MLRPTALVAGPTLLFLTLLVAPPSGMSVEAWRVAGVALLMAFWWATEVVPIPVTALLPIPLFPLLGIFPVEAAAGPFADPIIFLFMGGFMLAQAMQRWELHRRIAFAVIGTAGTGPVRLIGAFMLATALLSMWVSNTAVTVMMLPIAVSVIQVAGRPGSQGAPLRPENPEAQPGMSTPFAIALLLGVAYAASIGGVGTLIGTPPNALLAGFLGRELDRPIGFLQWMAVGLPIVTVLLPLCWLILTRWVFPVREGGPGVDRSSIRALQDALGSIRRPEIRVGVVFGLTATAWIFRPVLERWIPGLSDAGIAIGATIVLFLLPSGARDGEALLNWEWARRIPWDILLLFGGGLSLAAAISASGLALWLGDLFSGMRGVPFPVVLLLITGMVVLLTELTSNTASAAALIPIMAALAAGIGQDPVVITAAVALAASCAFMLPVATPPNAIVFGSGLLEMRHMLRAGLVMNVLVTILLPILVYLIAPLVL